MLWYVLNVYQGKWNKRDSEKLEIYFGDNINISGRGRNKNHTSYNKSAIIFGTHETSMTSGKTSQQTKANMIRLIDEQGYALIVLTI